MLHPPLKLAPGPAFWDDAARGLLAAVPALLPATHAHPGRGASGVYPKSFHDLSALRVVVPAFAHAQHLRAALGRALGRTFLPPRLCTMAGWLALQTPVGPIAGSAGAGNERLMALYAELRQHGWLKKLFAARRNTDLLPLAQTLLTVSDELTAALWPAMQSRTCSPEQRWDLALAQLPPTARALLSEEAQLVWTVWKAQLDADDPTVAVFAQMLALAAAARTPLVWIAPVAPDAASDAFLARWAQRQPVLPVLLDWRARAIAPALRSAWPELVEADETFGKAVEPVPAWPATSAVVQPDLFASASTVTAGAPAPGYAGIAVSPGSSLEDEAQRGAQTVIDWLQRGLQSIAIVAQDRVAARRIRALLQRAAVMVADETGWKLSTTRAASALAAWFEVVGSRAESTALLDFLKSPFLAAGADDHAELVMTIELALRRANVAGGWRTVMAAVPNGPAREWLQSLSTQAASFRDRHAVSHWLNLTRSTLDALGIGAALSNDAAGMQVLAMLATMGDACSTMTQEFSFAEWRAYLSLQLETTAFLPPASERRVVMLPLNGTHLRSFDAVLLVGADAVHFPSVAIEVLFFADAVRRELGLPTRESRQQQQLRDFAELLQANATVVLSWQAHRDGEPIPVSNWIARLELSLARGGQAPLSLHQAPLPTVQCQIRPQTMPQPAAAVLLPKRLSASGYTSLVACPYQFFATRMLGLSGLDEFSEQLGKRDYGDWLHRILHLYHVGVRDQGIAADPDTRLAFLQGVTRQVFHPELTRSAAALGYHDRWQKALPAYLAWAAQRETEGWQFVFGEEARQQPLRWAGGEILLHGRIDRIDRNADGEIAVLDYKTSNAPSLKKRIEGAEEHQLAFYGLLSPDVTTSAGYVALEPGKQGITVVDAPDYAQWQTRLQQRLDSTMQAIAAGAPLRASGIESVCQYCDVRGLCRKGAW